MLCPTCPKRASCKTICADLSRELARSERPQIEFTKSPQQLEGIELRNAIQSYFRSDSEEVQEVEVAPAAPAISHVALYAALTELTSRQRECLNLFFWQGLSKKKIAEKLGLSRPTIIQHLDAAITSIRTRYKEAESTDTYTLAHRGEGL